MIHPSEALVERGTTDIPVLSPVEHFAGTEKFVRKAMSLQAERGGDFDITIDLEDGAPKGQDEENLTMAVEMIRSDENKYNRVGVRILDPDSPFWGQQVETLGDAAGVRDRIAYITIPKARTAEEVWRVIEWMRSCGLTCKVHIIMETLEAFRNLDVILGGVAAGQIEVADFGLMDFTAAHQGVLDSRVLSTLQFSHPLIEFYKAQHVATCLVHGVVPANNVTISLEPGKAFTDAFTARSMFGFLRMWSIYPDQIDEIMKAMQSPYTEKLLNRCAAVLAQAQDASWGPIGFKEEDGKVKMEDRATYRLYWTILQRAKGAGVELPVTAQERFFNVN